MDITLSPIIAGTMNWGVWNKKMTTAQMTSLMHSCLEYDITTFDHADIYGGYTTESEFGAAFSASGINREDIQLISKCGIQHTEGRDNKVKHYDYSKDYIIKSVEGSLQNLHTEYLDLLLLHRPSPLMQPDEIAEAVAQLKADGKIKSFGVSNFTNSQTDLIRSRTEVSCNQIQFSATHHEAMLDGSLDYMQVNNIKPLAWSPIGSIFKTDDSQAIRLKLLLMELVVKYEVTADVVLLAWIRQHPSGIVPVTGSTNPKRLKNQMKATKLTLDTEDWFAIWTESMGHKVP
ncbi:MAG: aldo/keto reductase [Flavobacterium sp. MedPE-SWcel]|uniref:aldo/keto reductase n=1 Tax=uncultured Flavobacterium sp. TaxID=165435 RepID=UPI00091EB393|nr:aldo/keto reductase [uncultured Flavobacterium sp.]OIQ19363.1 MAG: aldo/keto reductase [Flavobacterium sp. MedPE-SWcel]